MIAKWSRLWLSPAYSWCLCQSHHPLLHLQWPALVRGLPVSLTWTTTCGLLRGCRDPVGMPKSLPVSIPHLLCWLQLPPGQCAWAVFLLSWDQGLWGLRDGDQGVSRGDNLLAASPDIETFTECRQLCIQSEDCPDQVSISRSAHKDLRTRQAM